MTLKFRFSKLKFSKTKLEEHYCYESPNFGCHQLLEKVWPNFFQTLVWVDPTQTLDDPVDQTLGNIVVQTLVDHVVQTRTGPILLLVDPCDGVDTWTQKLTQTWVNFLGRVFDPSLAKFEVEFPTSNFAQT